MKTGKITHSNLPHKQKQHTDTELVCSSHHVLHTFSMQFPSRPAHHLQAVLITSCTPPPSSSHHVLHTTSKQFPSGPAHHLQAVPITSCTPPPSSSHQVLHTSSKQFPSGPAHLLQAVPITSCTPPPSSSHHVLHTSSKVPPRYRFLCRRILMVAVSASHTPLPSPPHQI
jgi:hypothetical protein